MSRRTDYNNLPTGEQTLQDEEAISGTGEGDEEMEDAQQEEEGYSASGVSRHIDQHPNVLHYRDVLIFNGMLG